MEWVWIILGIILCIVGIIGSLLPLLPGPPIAYVGILLQLFRNPDPFESKTYWIFAGIVVVSLILDYLIPIWGTKKFGGTKYGAWGCTIGFLAAFGSDHGELSSAHLQELLFGELIGGQDSHKSFKAALDLLLVSSWIFFKDRRLFLYALLDHRQHLATFNKACDRQYLFLIKSFLWPIPFQIN
jgi:uncharacterized protein YqgC (DUF456 family)